MNWQTRHTNATTFHDLFLPRWRLGLRGARFIAVRPQDPRYQGGGRKNRNLVDPASSIRLSQRLSHACLSINDYTVKLRMAHYISYSLFDGLYYLDNRSNSRANTCIKPKLTNGCIY